MLNGPLILIVGVCAAGKTTLSKGLKQLGYNAKSFAQEHSVSPYVWWRRNPDFLILLDCQYDTIKIRKQISWGEEKYAHQQEILQEARVHADMIVKTDRFTPMQLVNFVDKQLKEKGVHPNPG